jgi:hypothetical protein
MGIFLRMLFSVRVKPSFVFLTFRDWLRFSAASRNLTLNLRLYIGGVFLESLSDG